MNHTRSVFRHLLLLLFVLLLVTLSAHAPRATATGMQTTATTINQSTPEGPALAGKFQIADRREGVTVDFKHPANWARIRDTSRAVLASTDNAIRGRFRAGDALMTVVVGSYQINATYLLPANFVIESGDPRAILELLITESFHFPTSASPDRSAIVETTLGGHPAAVLRIKNVRNLTNYLIQYVNGSVYDYVLIVLSIDGYPVVFGAVTLPGEMDRFQPVAEAVAASAQVNPILTPTPGPSRTPRPTEPPTTPTLTWTPSLTPTRPTSTPTYTPTIPPTPTPIVANTYTSPDGGFSFRYPDGWAVDDTSSPPKVILTTQRPAGLIEFSIVVGAENIVTAYNTDRNPTTRRPLTLSADKFKLTNGVEAPLKYFFHQLVGIKESSIKVARYTFNRKAIAGLHYQGLHKGPPAGDTYYFVVDLGNETPAFVSVVIEHSKVSSDFEKTLLNIAGSIKLIDAAAVDPTATATKAAQSGSRPAPTIRQWASKAKASSQYGDDSWSAAQATGEPNTETCGDNRSAWASSSSRGKDSLTLTFDQPVTPTQINIYQTYNPGAIISVELLPADGSRAIKLEDSADAGTDCPGVFTLDLDLDDIKPINGVKITLDQTITGSWNEIDAVELVGIPNNNIVIEPSSTPDPNTLRQWASGASASSQYGDPSWSAAQAIGEPDTTTCGDNRSAWASSSSRGKDSLTLYYDKPVFPTQVNIYQTYNPGAIISIELLPADGSRAIKVPNSADLGTDCPGVFSVSITLDDIKPINGVRINLDQSITNGWNEIDAVELVGRPSR